VTSIYIATRFDWYRQAALARHLLTEAGHHVTSRWIDEAARFDGVCAAVPIGDPRRAANARMDLDDLEAAEAILVLVPPGGGCGMWLELGYAMALGKRVVMVGPARERTIFAELAGVEVFARLNEAVEALRAAAPRICKATGKPMCGKPAPPDQRHPCSREPGHDGSCQDGPNCPGCGSHDFGLYGAPCRCGFGVDPERCQTVFRRHRLSGPARRQCGLPVGHDGPCEVRR
jgi:hypothetical protein